MEAQVWMTGRVGGDVDVRESASSPWSTFRLACTPRVVRGGEWGDEQTTWVTVSCSHRLAEHVRLSLRKGDPVVVVGKLRTRRWFDANGVEHEQLQIRASTVGHDLAVGTSSFYRPRRDGAEPGVDAAQAAEGEVEPPSEAGEGSDDGLPYVGTPDFPDDPEEQGRPEPSSVLAGETPPTAAEAPDSVMAVGEAVPDTGRRSRRGRAA